MICQILTLIITLGPILFIISLILSNRDTKKNSSAIVNIPYFIYGFVLLCILQNLGFIPAGISQIAKDLSKNLLILAMAGVGLRVSFNSIIKFGIRAFAVAIISFSIQIIIAIQFVT